MQRIAELIEKIKSHDKVRECWIEMSVHHETFILSAYVDTIYPNTPEARIETTKVLTETEIVVSQFPDIAFYNWLQRVENEIFVKLDEL